MEDRVLVNDENNVRVGKTFRRRAQQLVRKQKAIWADEAQTAIRLSAAVDMGEWAESEATPIFETEPADTDSLKERRLYALAAKKLRDKRYLVWHSILFIPINFIIILFVSWLGNNIFYSGSEVIFLWGLLLGSWTTGYVIHIFQYCKKWANLSSWLRTDKLRIEREVMKFKSMEWGKVELALEKAEL